MSFIVEIRSAYGWEALHDVVLHRVSFPAGNCFVKAHSARAAIFELIKNKECLLPMRVIRALPGARAVHMFTRKQVKDIAEGFIK